MGKLKASGGPAGLQRRVLSYVDALTERRRLQAEAAVVRSGILSAQLERQATSAKSAGCLLGQCGFACLVDLSLLFLISRLHYATAKIDARTDS